MLHSFKNLWKSHSYYLRHSQVQDSVLLKNIPEMYNWKQEFSQVGGCDECDIFYLRVYWWFPETPSEENKCKYVPGPIPLRNRGNEFLAGRGNSIKNLGCFFNMHIYFRKWMACTWESRKQNSSVGKALCFSSITYVRREWL